jgi:nucleotide-binding universal stress UspA family protein
MSSFNTILAACDFSPDAHRAARRAALLAREHGATLRLLHVINYMIRAATVEPWLQPQFDLEQRIAQDARQALEALAREVAAPGQTVEQEIRSGLVLDEILAAAGQADLLVLGPRGLRPIHELILGTAAERLLHKSKRPMLIVKQGPGASYKRVLVPVDFSDHSMSALRFAHELVPGAEICLFHAFEPPAEGIMRNAGVSEEKISAYRVHEQQQARAQMDTFIAAAGVMANTASPLIQCGDPRMLVSSVAESFAADLIVIGKHGRSRLAEYLLGGTTRATLARARCDIAVVPE